MSLPKWLESGWLVRHQTSAQEITGLLDIVDRDLRDARSDISPDWRFGIAYNAALKLCTIMLYAEGYKPEKTLQHYRALQSLSVILGPERKADADYLNACRAKRNTAEYDCVGCTTGSDADELIEFTEELKKDVIQWLKTYHPDIIMS